MKCFRDLKSISIIITIMMILELILPYSFANADVDSMLSSIIPTDNITKVTVLAEDEDGIIKNITDINNYRPVNGDKITLKVDIVLEALHNFSEGAKLTYPLPEIFENATGSGNLGSVGVFEIIGGEVVCTFNDIRDEFDQGLLVDDASFTIDAEYSLNNELIEYTLELPGQADIVLNFKPVGGQSVSKAGIAESGGLSSNYVTWTVDVNTELNTLNNAELVDDLIQRNPGKHTFDKNTIEAYELSVNAEGDISQSTTGVAIIANVSSTTSAAITVSYNAENTKATFGFPDGNKAYRIIYKSIIDENDSDDGRATYENKASFTNNGVTAIKTDSVTVNWGPPIEKSVSRSNSYGKSANWTVKYNYNRKTIEQSKAFIIDKITGKHIIDESIGIKVYDENSVLIDSSLYSVTVDADKMGYKLHFNNEINQPYQIKYTTVRSDYLVTSGSVSNIVIRGNDNKTDTSRFYYANPAIDKVALGIDYNRKTIKWRIRVNRDSYNMKNIIITDIYDGEGMEYIDGTLSVDGLTSDQYTFTDNGLAGFTFATNSNLVINNPFTIIFETDYTIEDVGTNDRKFENTSSIKWDADGKEYNSSDSAVAYAHKNQLANGYKDGLYNYETKEFSWAALVNFNNNTLNDAIFKDYLPEGQEIDIGSIVIQPVTLNANASVITAGLPITTPVITSSAINAFEVHLGSITGPYLITYKSVDEDGFFPKTVGKYRVENRSELWDGVVNNAQWSDEVVVAYTDKTINKYGSGVNKTSSIDWNFKLNYAQSKMSEVKIIDTVGKDADGNPNQLVLEDTFKVYEVKLLGDMNSGNPTETHTLVPANSGVYTVVFDRITGTFTLEFSGEIDKAYYIEYRSVFLGAPNDDVSNEASLTYKHSETYTENSSVEIVNYYFNGSGSTKKVGLKISKTNKSGDKLEGAKFSLHNINDINLFEGTTDIDGILTLPYKIGEGNYILREEEAPTGYFKNDDLQINLKLSSADEDNGIQTVEIVDEKYGKADIRLKKHDESGSALAGAEFTLYKEGTIVGSPITSNSNGDIIFKDIETGVYTIKETSSPNGYNHSNAIINVVIKANDVLKRMEVEFNGTLYTEPFIIRNTLVYVDATVVINKTDHDNKPLVGAEFTLYDSTQNIVQKVISDNNGEVKFTNVGIGTYTIKETKAPEGHYKSFEVITVEVTRSSSLTSTNVSYKVDGVSVDNVTILNDVIDIKLKKVNENDEAISDAEFTLYDNNEVAVQVVKSDNLGIVKFTKVPIGNYTIKETDAPIGYKELTDIINIQVKENDSHENIQVLYNGNISTEPYIVRNELIDIYGDIVINKTDSFDKPLAGAEFTIYDSDENIIKTAISDSDGKVEFKEMELGTYTIKETKSPEGHYKSSVTVAAVISRNVNLVDTDVVLSIDGKIYDNINVVNDAIDIKISKVDKYDRPLADAEFTLYDDNEVVIQVIKSNDLGEGHFSKVPIGKYIIKETKAPSGYYLSDKIVNVEVKENNETEKTDLILKVDEDLVYGAVVFEDEKIPVIPTKGKIVIEKIDENDNYLEGAEFTLYDDQGLVIKNGITDADGLLSFIDIPLGTYELKETRAPEGYLISEKDIFINIENDDIQIHVFTNKKEVVSIPDETSSESTLPVEAIIRGNILIMKIDENEEPLSGAEFGLYNENGQLIETMISDIDGKVMFNNFIAGIYSIKEIDAPIGYEIVSERKFVEIAESKTYTYKFINVTDEAILENEDIPAGWIDIDDPIIPEGGITIPDTGSVLIMKYLIYLGLMLILSGMGIKFYKKQKKWKNNR